MSRVCSVCNKGKLSGNLVSHSNRKTPRQYSANLQKVKVKNADGTVSSEYVCARCLKSGKVERA
ncbi:MAG: 50S ribosomal protein L28 [Bacillota bacterium]|nr:MAG: 50S ribosomal protein L28 [Bacillota bacterium]